MKPSEVIIGQTWKRKDGRKVKITAVRISRGLRELELTPLDGGRKSWKWDEGIINELDFVEAQQQRYA